LYSANPTWASAV